MRNAHTREMQIPMIDGRDLDGKKGSAPDRLGLPKGDFLLTAFLKNSNEDSDVKSTGPINLSGITQANIRSAPWEPPRHGNVQAENIMMYVDGGEFH